MKKIKYTIPRKTRLLSEDCQEEITLNSREGKDLINSINNLTWEAGELDRSFTISKICKVDNPTLEREFQAKRAEMKDEGRTPKELTETLAFKTELLSGKVKEYCKKGLTCPGANDILGDSSMGVSLWRCPDLCLKSMSCWHSTWTVFLVIFRVVKGKVKCVTSKKSDESQSMEPTPNYDCHVSKNIPNTSTIDTASLLTKTQYYLYEYNDEGFTVKRPRQCLPYAIVHIKKAAQPLLLPEIKQSSIISIETTIQELTVKETACTATNKAPTNESTTMKQLVLDDSSSQMAWRGLIATNNHSLGVVAIHSGHKIGLKMWKSFLDVKSRIPLDNLLKVIPGDIRTAWTNPLIYRDYTFSLCTLKPCGPPDSYNNFIKTLSMKDYSAAVVTVNSSTILFLVPSCKLTVELGFSANTEPLRMFCIVRRRRQSQCPSVEVRLNAEVAKPSVVVPENLNINTKIEVPYPLQHVNSPLRKRVTVCRRSKSIDSAVATSGVFPPKNTRLKRQLSTSTEVRSVAATQKDKEDCDDLKIMFPDSRGGSDNPISISSAIPSKMERSLSGKKSISRSSDAAEMSSSIDEVVVIDSAGLQRETKSSPHETSPSALSSLFQVMRSKSIPFLEETHLDHLMQIEQQEQNRVSFTPTLESRLTDENEPTNESLDRDIRHSKSYESHRRKLVPCSKKESYTKIQCKPDIQVTQTDSGRTKNRCSDDIAKSEFNEQDFNQTRDLNAPPIPREDTLLCDPSTPLFLKRRPSLFERVNEIKKLYRLCVDEEDMDDPPVTCNSSQIVSSPEDTESETSRNWSSGLQVVEATLIELDFMKIDEEIENYDMENAFEYLDIDGVRETPEYQEVTLWCSTDLVSTSFDIITKEASSPDSLLKPTRDRLHLESSSSNNGQEPNNFFTDSRNPLHENLQVSKQTCLDKEISLNCMNSSPKAATVKTVTENVENDEDSRHRRSELSTVNSLGIESDNRSICAQQSIVEAMDLHVVDECVKQSDISTANLQNTNEGFNAVERLLADVDSQMVNGSTTSTKAVIVAAINTDIRTGNDVDNTSSKSASILDGNDPVTNISSITSNCEVNTSMIELRASLKSAEVQRVTFPTKKLEEKENKSNNRGDTVLAASKRPHPPPISYSYKGALHHTYHPPPVKIRRLIDDNPRPYLHRFECRPPPPLMHPPFPFPYRPCSAARYFKLEVHPYARAFSPHYRQPLLPQHRCYGDSEHRL